MRKFVMVFVLCVFVLASLPFSASAQEVASCTEEEVTASVEALAEGYATFLALGEVSGDLTMETYRELALGYEALGFAHWTEVMPSLPACPEVFYPAYIYGRLYDDALNVVLLRWQYLYETEMEDSAYAESFAAVSEPRNESLSNSLASIEDVTAAVMMLALGGVPCTEEQTAAFEEAVAEYAAYYEEIGLDIEAASTDDLADYILEYEALSTEFDAGFGEVACSEIFSDYAALSSVFTDSLSVVSLSRIAQIEAEMGDPDAAQYLADQSVARAEILMATVESLMAEAE